MTLEEACAKFYKDRLVTLDPVAADMFGTNPVGSVASDPHKTKAGIEVLVQWHDGAEMLPEKDYVNVLNLETL